MEKKTAPSLKSAEVLFLSLFGVGFIPFAPGTMGTIATLPFLYWLTQLKVPWPFLIPFIVICTIVSSFLSEHIQQKFNAHDPQWIVIDEFLGMLVAWLFMANNSLIDLFGLFLLFRFFDIIKIWPASYFDKKVKHGAGIIIDDLVSGVYAGLTYRIIRYFLDYLNIV